MKLRIIFGLVLLTVVLLIVGGCGAAKVPEPEIKTGEFPFKLTYELRGEVIVVEDVYVCEYLGVDWNFGQGYRRRWKGYVKSTGEDGVFLTEDSERKIYCSVGKAEYYMGDESDLPDREYVPHFYHAKTDPSKIDLISEEEISEQYSVKLLEWEFSSPITNTFE